jgi:hypothetical protein
MNHSCTAAQVGVVFLVDSAELAISTMAWRLLAIDLIDAFIAR